MTTAVKNKVRRTIAKTTAARTKKPARDVTGALKPFSVVNGPYLFWFTPTPEGFSVTCQNVFGVNAQGGTFEEALLHAVSMAKFVEECRTGHGLP